MKKNLALFSLSIIASLIIVELFIRLNPQNFHTNVPPWLMKYWQFKGNDVVKACEILDKDTIFRTQENQEATDYCRPTDKYGFRETPLQTEKSAKNILFLGDSFTYGDWVDDNETMPYFVGKMLKEKNYHVNILNGGIRSYGMDQEILLLEKHILPLITPDIVVWNIFENDEDDNNQACLFRINNHQLIQQSGRFNSLYIMDFIYNLTPNILKRSYLYWFLFNLIPQRYTLGCTLSRDDYSHTASEKTKLLIKRMEDLSKKNNFQLIITYSQSQYGFVDPKNRPEDYIKTIERQKETLMNSGMSPIFVTDKIKSNISSSTLSGKLETDLFASRDPGLYGTKHMSALGNMEFARVVTEKIGTSHE